MNDLAQDKSGEYNELNVILAGQRTRGRSLKIIKTQTGTFKVVERRYFLGLRISHIEKIYNSEAEAFNSYLKLGHKIFKGRF